MGLKGEIRTKFYFCKKKKVENITEKCLIIPICGQGLGLQEVEKLLNQSQQPLDYH